MILEAYNWELNNVIKYKATIKQTASQAEQAYNFECMRKAENLENTVFFFFFKVMLVMIGT